MITFSKLGQFGRLGNQLWQIAALIGYAKKYNTSYFIKDWKYAHYFKNSFNKGNKRLAFTYREKDFTYDPIPAKTQLEIEGYFQSEKYFEGADIKEQFEPSEEVEKYINEKYGEWLKGETVSVHIRRTDYLNLGDYHYNLDMNYYDTAINYFNRNTTNFIFFSDDIDWCIRNIDINNALFIKGEKDIIDLFLMSKCKHNIIANSSFSWWASYLNKNPHKKVIAPSKDKWFGKLMNKSVDDLYLDNWILV